jgi:hypothetical protein
MQQETPTDRAARITASATKWMAVFTLFLVIFSGLTLIILRNQLKEMHEGGIDTHNLADAAIKTEKSAERSAQASSDFADSAVKINGGLSDAVSKLNDQVGQLTATEQQTARLAAATERANTNVVNADRPWMGAYVSVANFTPGSRPTFTVAFVNSGRRPARVDLVATREGSYLAFPANPDREYVFDTTPSTDFIVPGGNVSSIQTVPNQLTQGEMNFFNAGTVTFFVFAKVEYRDPQTDARYWTHICMRYVPKMKTDTDSGFRNCQEYTDAK